MHFLAFFVVTTVLASLSSASVAERDAASRQLLQIPPGQGMARLRSDQLDSSRAQRLSTAIAVDARRKLTQSDAGTCAWDDEAEQCFLSAGAVLDLLSEVVNPLSNYLSRSIECTLASDRRECRALDCSWNGLFCGIRHEEFREFVSSARCLEEVDHIVELQARAFECDGLGRERVCENNDFCTWDPILGICFIDSWLYFHGIRSIEGRPEGYNEVFDELLNHLNTEIIEAQDNGDIVFASDILEFEPSDFVCPSGYDQLVCDYVEALTPLLLMDGYCSSAYPLAPDLLFCLADDFCQSIPSLFGFSCGVADSIITQANIEASRQVLAASIDDPEARAYELQSLDCLTATEEDECGRNCTWVLDRACLLSPTWAESEVFRLVGETNNDVCQFYTSDVTTGCIELQSAEECSGNRDCVWLDVYNSCQAGLYVWLEIALGGSDAVERLRAEEETCFDTSFDECSALSSTPDTPRGETEEEGLAYTALTRAIGANNTIVTFVF